ncbi:hypothetical protein Acsp06_62730 [Actinomycetospora sp. NBRC 106375]|uniref:DUF2188 domain-containing protein n=1 Tax=Actinomycetospora sp. NBRC 106375 TaxID=3032207 RepID=UPI0024A4638E|nr:DUF2188 domain-containing protein [Actinomycetospora sp. NBRC 106375]GLZ50088.1 hypothetical protein Acsp06_62730 [Actinomycetospora sp. NBRC 106375]
MSDRHVVPAEDGWHVEKDDAQRASAKTPTQAEAISRAVEIVANDGGGQVVVHGSDGQIRESRTVAADEPHPKRTAAAATVEALAEGTEVTARAAVDGLAEQGAAVLEGDKSVRAGADDAATILETAGGQIADQADRTAREVRGETAAAASRAGERVEATAARGARAARRQADRAAVAGAGVGDELDSLADTTGQRIHAVTESWAAPLDQVSDQVLLQVGRASHALNPVRFAGRALGATVATALYLASLVSARGTRSVRRAVRVATEDH